MFITRHWRDRQLRQLVLNQLAITATFHPASLALGANNGAAVDALGWGGYGRAIIQTGAIAGTDPTLNWKVQQSANGTSGWADVEAFTQIVTANQIRLREFPFAQQFLRGVVTVGGTAGPTFVTAMNLGPAAPPILLPGQVTVGVYVAINDAGLGTELTDLTLGPGDMAIDQIVSAWGTPYTLGDGRRVADAAPLSFRPTAAEEACTLAGWYIAQSAETKVLLGWEPFPVPIPLPGTDAAVTIRPRFGTAPSGDFSAVSVWNG